MDVAITWYGMLFLHIREGNQVLATLMKRIGRGTVFAIKILAISVLICYLVWIDAVAGHSPEFAAAVRLGAGLMVVVFGAVIMWGVWVTRRRLNELMEDRRDWIEMVTHV